MEAIGSFGGRSVVVYCYMYMSHACCLGLICIRILVVGKCLLAWSV